MEVGSVKIHQKDEIYGKERFNLYIQIIPYRYLLTNRYHLFIFSSFHLVFHSQLDLNSLKRNVFVFCCNRPQCTQKLLLLPHFCWKRFFCRCILLWVLPRSSRSSRYRNNHPFYSYFPECYAHASSN